MRKIRESARGEVCTVRIPDICRWTDGVILAHVNGAGVGMKELDFIAAYCCAA